MPPSSRTKLKTETRMTCQVGRFPISSSGGQLLVYVYSLPGRSVILAQLAQKKNAVRSARLLGTILYRPA